MGKMQISLKDEKSEILLVRIAKHFFFLLNTA
jgi:hypothetical protein